MLRFRCNPDSELSGRVGTAGTAFPTKASGAAWLWAAALASRTPSCRNGSAAKTTPYQAPTPQAPLFKGTVGPLPPKAPSLVGTGGKRVRSAHNAEGVSDPQVGSETSTDHGSGLYDD